MSVLRPPRAGITPDGRSPRTAPWSFDGRHSTSGSPMFARFSLCRCCTISEGSSSTSTTRSTARYSPSSPYWWRSGPSKLTNVGGKGANCLAHSTTPRAGLLSCTDQSRAERHDDHLSPLPPCSLASLAAAWVTDGNRRDRIIMRTIVFFWSVRASLRRERLDPSEMAGLLDARQVGD